MSCLVAALYFLEFWRRSRDRFFALFAGAFMLLGISWLIAILSDITYEFNRSVYLTRLVAFLVIVLAVIDKNRSPTVP